jgi:hypothetical protein
MPSDNTVVSNPQANRVRSRSRRPVRERTTTKLSGRRRASGRAHGPGYTSWGGDRAATGSRQRSAGRRPEGRSGDRHSGLLLTMTAGAIVDMFRWKIVATISISNRLPLVAVATARQYVTSPSPGSSSPGRRRLQEGGSAANWDASSTSASLDPGAIPAHHLLGPTKLCSAPIPTPIAASWPTCSGSSTSMRPADGSSSIFRQRSSQCVPAGAELYFICTNLATEIHSLQQRGVRCSEIENARWGAVTKSTSRRRRDRSRAETRGHGRTELSRTRADRHRSRHRAVTSVGP